MWLIDGKEVEQPIKDNIYIVKDPRKGGFIGICVSAGNTFSTFERLYGRIRWASTENQIFVGDSPDEVSVRNWSQLITLDFEEVVNNLDNEKYFEELMI